MKILGVALVLVSAAMLLQAGQPSQTQPAITAAFEHVAFNVADPQAVAKWYCDNMGMKIAKTGSSPFVADVAGRMMFEFYHKAEVKILDCKQIDPNSFHVAFETSDVPALRDRLVKAGAKVTRDLATSSNGDVVITLRDPWGLPIQLLKRTQPLLTR
jgi:glyoxylase I family protein